MSRGTAKVVGLRLGRVELAVVALPEVEPELDGDAALTPAEREIARLVVDGHSNKEIARRRGVSVKTVANQLAAIYTKLGTRSRFELAAVLARVRS